MTIKIEDEGWEGLANTLNHAIPEMARAALRDAMENASTVVVKAARDSAPVAKEQKKGGEEPGYLRENIDYTISVHTSSEGYSITSKIEPVHGLDPSTWYGFLQEFGTFCQQGKHWLARAWETVGREPEEIFIERLTQTCEDLDKGD
jgi:HK97 gp10 family phage protein